MDKSKPYTVKKKTFKIQAISGGKTRLAKLDLQAVSMSGRKLPRTLADLHEAIIGLKIVTDRNISTLDIPPIVQNVSPTPALGDPGILQRYELALWYTLRYASY